MDEIRTPWRMRYIASTSRKAACIFCPPYAEPPRVQEAGREHFILRHGATAFIILNLYPYTTGHLMVVPYRHLQRFGDLTGEERAELGRLLRESERILRAATGAHRFHAGINLGRAAGAGVEGHLHAHLVPRDTCGGWADATGAESPALPVAEAFRRLAPHFAVGPDAAP
ncbi:MAG: HIT domain-containing protein [bacterium]